MTNAIQHRYDFVYLFDVENGNPNGDPDAGNMPRIDPETSHGLITDVCLKRKVRNYVEILKNGEAPYCIYIKEKAVLNRTHDEALDATGAEGKAGEKGKRGKGDEVDKAKKWLCDKYFDIRTFGAVMMTDKNCGQVRGPVQFNFARSIDPIVPMEVSISRVAVTTEKEAEQQGGGNRTMGRKHIVPYALYRAEGYISANLAEKSGFSESDLQLFWEALANMFEHDHSAARGKMNARKLNVFKHATPLGNAPAQKLFERVKVERSAGCEEKPPRAFSDYRVSLDKAALPPNVQIEEKT
jgi:CRISPR-associated protein Csd2